MTIVKKIGEGAYGAVAIVKDEKLIKIYGNNKGYSLGNNYDYQVVNPRQYVTKVKLA